MHWMPIFEYSNFSILDMAEGFLLRSYLEKNEKNVEGGSDEKWITTEEYSSF